MQDRSRSHRGPVRLRVFMQPRGGPKALLEHGAPTNAKNTHAEKQTLQQDGNRRIMVPRVLGAIACGACAVSAFVVPAVVRPSARQDDASSRHSRSTLRQAPLRMAGEGGAGGEGSSQSRREVIAGTCCSDREMSYAGCAACGR